MPTVHPFPFDPRGPQSEVGEPSGQGITEGSEGQSSSASPHQCAQPAEIPILDPDGNFCVYRR